MLAKSKLTMDLPKIGDKLNRIMTACTYDPEVTYSPQPCVVTYVNQRHKYYQVRFLGSGITECYNLPMFDHAILNRVCYGAIPVACVETGFVYSTTDECARDMDLDAGNISVQLRGGYGQYKGFHFFRIL